MNSSYNNSHYSDPQLFVGRQGAVGLKRLNGGYVEQLVKTRMEDDKKSDFISHKILKNIVILTLTLFIAALAMVTSAHIFGDNLSRAGHSSSTENLEIIVGNEYLNIPANKVRFFSQRRSAAYEKIELYLHWPSLSGFRDSLRKDFNDTTENANLVFVSIEQRHMSFDMSGRVAPIYAQFFEGTTIPAHSGLVKQGLSSDGGFIDEDLYYAASSPYPFATRCIRETSTTTPFCIRDVHVGKNLMLTYRFHKKHLANWIELEQAIRAMTKSMIISPS